MDEDDIDFQIDALEKYGVDEIYIEYPYYEKHKESKLDELIEKLRSKDVLVVHDLDRFGKTIKGLQELAEYFSLKEIDLVVLKDNIDTTTAIGRYFLYWMCVLGDMEKSVLQEFTKIGMKTAKEEGRTGGRPGKSDEEIEKILNLHYEEKYSVKEISEITGWATSTIYKYIRENREKKDSNL